MKVAVWDTYVEREDGKTMHFDIFVKDTEKNSSKIFSYGEEYLAEKSFKTGNISSEECHYCHVAQVPEYIAERILKKGYFIYEMENCH